MITESNDSLTIFPTNFGWGRYFLFHQKRLGLEKILCSSPIWGGGSILQVRLVLLLHMTKLSILIYLDIDGSLDSDSGKMISFNSGFIRK